MNAGEGCRAVALLGNAEAGRSPVERASARQAQCRLSRRSREAATASTSKPSDEIVTTRRRPMCATCVVRKQQPPSGRACAKAATVHASWGFSPDSLDRWVWIAVCGQSDPWSLRSALCTCRRTRILKLAAIRGLGALAFLVEPFENASGSTLVTIGGRCDRIRPVTVTWLPRLS